MPTVIFTNNLKRHLDCPDKNVAGDNLHDVLTSMFQDNPQLVSYILDDQFRLRKHIMVSIDNQIIKDRIHLSDRVMPESTIYFFQALSGG